MESLTMPIEADTLRATELTTLPVRPDTNEHALLAFLIEHRDLAFTPKELSEATDVTYGSIYPTLQRLEAKGLVENVDQYWMAVEDDRVAAQTASLLGWRALADREDADEFSQNPEWADDLPDLDENA